jgi:hypothetical protein
MHTLVLSLFLLVTACDENYCIHLFQSRDAQAIKRESLDQNPNLVHPMHNQRFIKKSTTDEN